MLGKEYFKRQATTLLKIANSTSDPLIVNAVVTKAVDLKSHVDGAMPMSDASPRAPDVEGPLDL